MAGVQRKPVDDPKVRRALEAIRKRNAGVLVPAAVVEAAEHENSPLHDYFTWEDSEAARAWRLHQARNLIRVVVNVLEGTETECRVYVSMHADREEEGGGYRALVDVLSDEEQRGLLLVEALEEIAILRRKYGLLKELAAVFAAADEVASPVK